MAKVKIVKNELEVRLRTVEQQLEDIFGRIGLLDEQARQAGYHAYLAMVQMNQVRQTPPSSNECGATDDECDRQEALGATRFDQRVGKTTSRRSAHSSR
ncbi:MAG: hypothetical protein ACREQC_03645 [Candidatus Binataceae bacterium]